MSSVVCKSKFREAISILYIQHKLPFTVIRNYNPRSIFVAARQLLYMEMYEVAIINIYILTIMCMHEID